MLHQGNNKFDPDHQDEPIGTQNLDNFYTKLKKGATAFTTTQIVGQLLPKCVKTKLPFALLHNALTTFDDTTYSFAKMMLLPLLAQVKHRGAVGDMHKSSAEYLIKPECPCAQFLPKIVETRLTLLVLHYYKSDVVSAWTFLASLATSELGVDLHAHGAHVHEQMSSIGAKYNTQLSNS